MRQKKGCGVAAEQHTSFTASCLHSSSHPGHTDWFVTLQVEQFYRAAAHVKAQISTVHEAVTQRFTHLLSSQILIWLTGTSERSSVKPLMLLSEAGFNTHTCQDLFQGFLVPSFGLTIPSVRIPVSVLFLFQPVSCHSSLAQQMASDFPPHPIHLPARSTCSPVFYS